MEVFHEGERAVQEMAGEAAMAERNSAIVTERIMRGALPFLEKQQMAVIAYVDRSGQLWTSILFGRPGFISSPDGLVVNIDLNKAAIQLRDPLWDSIGTGKPAGMLVIDLASRRRIRINGELSRPQEKLFQLAVREFYPNCPKYITRRSVRTAMVEPAGEERFIEGTELLKEQSQTLIQADTLFIGTAHPTRGFDASHRGGSPGFVEVLDDRTISIPDYVGNSMFNTLGNLVVDSRAGVTVPDFSRKQVLRMTGQAETVWNQTDPEDRSGGTHRFVKFHVERWNQEAPPPGMESEFFDFSPYNQNNRGMRNRDAPTW